MIFTQEFGETLAASIETIATPTDYFRYDIAVTDDNHPIANPLYTSGGDYAFLMENQWIARLPDVQEEPNGAAPDELILFYCDMFPFQKSILDPTTLSPPVPSRNRDEALASGQGARLAREDVPEYVHTELVPHMIKAFRAQTDDWGFPWYDAWTSYRLGQDAKRLSIALTEGQTWYHGVAPTLGNSKISMQVKGAYSAYDTLTDGAMSTFHHELFHNLQRNISLRNGGEGNVGGAENAWQFFSEGTAVLASSVGQPLVQFAQSLGARVYMSKANTVRITNSHKAT